MGLIFPPEIGRRVKGGRSRRGKPKEGGDYLEFSLKDLRLHFITTTVGSAWVVKDAEGEVVFGERAKTFIDGKGIGTSGVLIGAMITADAFDRHLLLNKDDKIISMTDEELARAFRAAFSDSNDDATLP